MIKTLGPLEDAPDLDSIAPILQNWADLIKNKDKPVSKAVFATLLYADIFCALGILFLAALPNIHACIMTTLAQVHHKLFCASFALHLKLLHEKCTFVACMPNLCPFAAEYRHHEPTTAAAETMALLCSCLGNVLTHTFTYLTQGSHMLDNE